MRITVKRVVSVLIVLCLLVIAHYFRLRQSTQPNKSGDRDESASTFPTERRQPEHTGQGTINYKGHDTGYSYHYLYDGDTWDGKFEILHGERMALSLPLYTIAASVYTVQSDDSASIVPLDLEELEGPIEVADCTGNRVTTLILSEFSGGTAGYYTAHVISLGSSCAEIAKIENSYNEISFEDLDHDGSWEAIVQDYSMARDEGGWTGWPAMDVILKYQNGQYQFAPELMKQPLPQDFMEQVGKARSAVKEKKEIIDSARDYMLELIYHGKGDQAWEFLDMICPTEMAEAKAEFADQLVIQLINSPYWAGVSKMNHWEYAQPDGELGCPEFAGRQWLVKTQ